jgi:hypothetical protein
MSVLEEQQSERKTDCPGYHKEAGNGAVARLIHSRLLQPQ